MAEGEGSANDVLGTILLGAYPCWVDDPDDHVGTMAAAKAFAEELHVHLGDVEEGAEALGLGEELRLATPSASIRERSCGEWLRTWRTTAGKSAPSIGVCAGSARVPRLPRSKRSNAGKRRRR